jgi:hypothetical protein
MSVRYQTPVYVCDMCAAEQITENGPEGWLLIPPSLGRPALHACLVCQDKPMRELKMLMDAAAEGDAPVLRRRQR